MKERTVKHRGLAAILAVVLAAGCCICTTSASYAGSDVITLLDWNDELADAHTHSFTLKVNCPGLLYIECGNEKNVPFSLKLFNRDGSLFEETRSGDGSKVWIENDEAKTGTYRAEVTSYGDASYTVQAWLYRSGPTYKEVANKAKSLATKNIKYKNLDVGYQSRLYGASLVTDVDLHERELYAMVGSFEPYIDIKKKDDGTAALRLAIKGMTAISSVKKERLDFEKVRFYTKDRTTTFELGDCTSKYKYDYYSGIHTTTASWWATLSSDSKQRSAQLDKLITIFKHKGVKVKVYEPSGAYIWCELSESYRKNWLATFQKYKKLLAMYS